MVSPSAFALVATAVSGAISLMRRDGVKAHHPQRLYPKYARVADLASRQPQGLCALSIIAPGIFSRTPSSTENPTAEDLGRSGIAICAFPRTGSTYLKFAIERSIESPGAVWRTHDVLAVPQLERAGLLVLIPLRDPRSTAISWSLYNNDEPSLSRMRSRLHSYAAWHRQVARYSSHPGVRFISFDYFSREPSHALTTKFKAAGIQPTHESLASDVVAADLWEDDATHGVEPRHTHVPSDHRAAVRADYEGLLADPKLASPLACAEALFDGLMKRAPQPPNGHCSP